MVNYKNGKIYEVVCNITGKKYVGSTAEILLSNRLAGHRSDYKSYINNKSHYTTSFSIIENGDFYINLLETYPCNNREELVARERYWYDKIECVNKFKPYRTIEEEKEYQKQYYIENKDKLQEYDKDYYNENKKEILEKQKQYNINNRDKILEYNKQYYLKNKKEILEKQKQYNIKNKKNS